MELPPSRIRVLFYIATMDAGGAERQVLELIRRLDRSRFEPILGLATRSGPLLSEVPGDVPIHAFQDQPRVHRFGMGRPRRWIFLAGLLRRERIDVVYDRTFQATLDIGPATWWRRTPRVSAVAADPQIQLDLYFPRRQWFWRRFAARVYRSAQVVLANSAGLRQQVIDYFQLSPDHVRVLPNVLDVDRIETLAAEKPVADSGQFRILTVGRIDAHKGHRDLLEAVRRLVQDQQQTQILWQILGDGPTRTDLIAEIERLGLGAQVEWLGVVKNPYPYYRAADLFCLPSLSEGSPNVLLEALALGTPVLSTDCAHGPREILEDGKWGTLTPVSDPAALVTAIADCVAHPKIWRERARQAQPVIRDRYSADAGVRRLEELLLEAVEM